MVEFDNQDLSGSRFRHVDLSGSTFRNIDLSGARLVDVDLVDVEISGWLDNLRINEVDVAPLIEAELDRRHPDRVKMRPNDAAGFREAWAILERLWAGTVERARRLPPELLHERVHDEWSFIETLRHLLFATDAWVLRAFLGRPSPYDALDLPHTEMGDVPGVPCDLEARPTLDEVLALRADRFRTVREVFEGLTDEVLAGHTEPVTAPGYPASESYAVQRCLRAAVNEEWEHRLYAERDLAVLEQRVRGR